MCDAPLEEAEAFVTKAELDPIARVPDTRKLDRHPDASFVELLERGRKEGTLSMRATNALPEREGG